MKRLFIILLLLCSLLTQGKIQAQIYSTASKRYHTYTSTGVALYPDIYKFRSTSIYGITNSRSYATAPMQVANGSIKTVASSITGGVLTNNEGYILHEGGKDQGAVIAGVPDLSLGDGWDVGIFLALLSMAYLLYVKRKDKQTITAKI